MAILCGSGNLKRLCFTFAVLITILWHCAIPTHAASSANAQNVANAVTAACESYRSKGTVFDQYYKNGVAYAQGCHAFVNYVWKDVFGYDVYDGKSSRTSDQTDWGNFASFLKNNARPGDILRVYGGNPHSVIITDVSSTGITYYEAGGRQNSKYTVTVHTTSYEQLVTWYHGTTNGNYGNKGYFIYQINDNIYQSVSSSGTGGGSTSSNYYKVTAQSGLWMRSQPNTSSNSQELRILPAGAIVKVTQISGSWGYGTYCRTSGWFSLNYAVQTDETSCDPIGCVDSVYVENNTVYVSGWAVDLDDVDNSVSITVLAGDILCGFIDANQYRPDVNADDDYHHHGVGDYHGFSGQCDTYNPISGTYPVRIMATNVGGNGQVVLYEKEFVFSCDNTGPEISDIRVYDVDTTGYTVSCTVTDDSGVDRVQFPSWTVANGQDDLAAEWWANPAVAGSRNGNTWTFRVRTSDHNEEEGTYLTHIYAYDIYDNSSNDGTSAVIDKHPPQVTGSKMGYNPDTDTFTIEYSGSNLEKVDHARMKIYESGTSADDAEWNEVVYRDGKLVGERKMELPKIHDDIEYKIISDLTWKQQEVLKDTLFYTISAQHPDFFVTLDYGDMPMYNGLKTGFIQSPDAPYMWLDVTPVWDGYTFLGWFTQKQGGEQVTSSTICTREEDHTLYAHWEKADPCAAGHSFGSWSEKSVATCTSKATHRAVCSVCGQEYGDIVEYGSLANHQYGDWNIVREPTAEQEGLKQRTCTVCGKVDEKLIDRLPPVVDENAPQIIVDTVTAKAGKTVTMNLSLKNNPGVNSVRLHLSYDTEALTLTDVKDLGILGEFTMDSSQMTKLPLIISWEGDKFENNFTEDGAFAALTFEVKPGVPEGQYSVSVSYDEEQYDIANTELNNVHLDIVNGGVTVKNIEPGDTDGDGSITNRDRMILSRYLAGWSGYDEMIDVSAADVDCDGNVTNRDRMILSRYLAGWAGYETLPYLK